MTQWQDSLKKLLDAIPPPVQPRYVDGPLLDPSLPELPEDHEAIINAYHTRLCHGEVYYIPLRFCVIKSRGHRNKMTRWSLATWRSELRQLRKKQAALGFRQ